MSKKIKKFIFPGAAIITSLYLSVLFAIGALIGYISTEFFLKKFIKTGRVKCLSFDFKKWQIHLHHWVIASSIILFAYISDSFSLSFFWSGILGGLIFHDIYADKRWHKSGKKWYHVVYKKPYL